MSKETVKPIEEHTNMLKFNLEMQGWLQYIDDSVLLNHKGILETLVIKKIWEKKSGKILQKNIGLVESIVDQEHWSYRVISLVVAEFRISNEKREKNVLKIQSEFVLVYFC